MTILGDWFDRIESEIKKDVKEEVITPKSTGITLTRKQVTIIVVLGVIIAGVLVNLEIDLTVDNGIMDNKLEQQSTEREKPLCPPEMTMHEKLGICVDKVEYERYLQVINETKKEKFEEPERKEVTWVDYSVCKHGTFTMTLINKTEKTLCKPFLNYHNNVKMIDTENDEHGRALGFFQEPKIITDFLTEKEFEQIKENLIYRTKKEEPQEKKPEQSPYITETKIPSSAKSYFVITTDGDWYGDFIDVKKQPISTIGSGNKILVFSCYDDKILNVLQYFGIFKNVNGNKLKAEIWVNGTMLESKETSKREAVVLEGYCKNDQKPNVIIKDMVSIYDSLVVIKNGIINEPDKVKLGNVTIVE